MDGCSPNILGGGVKRWGKKNSLNPMGCIVSKSQHQDQWQVVLVLVFSMITWLGWLYLSLFAVPILAEGWHCFWRWECHLSSTNILIFPTTLPYILETKYSELQTKTNKTVFWVILGGGSTVWGEKHPNFLVILKIYAEHKSIKSYQETLKTYFHLA
jgi:hypothetical protein